MFCKHCGNQLPENATFCPKCGKVNDGQSFGQNESYEPINTDNVFYNAQKDSDAGSILKFSIMGLAFSFILPILGLIFTIIAKTKVRNFVEAYGETEGRATVGKHLTIPGMISSIFFMVFWFIYTIVIVAMLGYLL